MANRLYTSKLNEGEPAPIAMLPKSCASDVSGDAGVNDGVAWSSTVRLTLNVSFASLAPWPVPPPVVMSRLSIVTVPLFRPADVVVVLSPTLIDLLSV